MIYQRKYVFITIGNMETQIKLIADELGLTVELVAVKVKELFHELEKLGAVEDGKIMVGYSVPAPDIRDELSEMVYRMSKEIDKICYLQPIVFDKKQQRPQFVEKLHKYRKRECHRKPIHWHRIRSNPRQR